MQNREYQHDDKDERHRGQQEIAGFDRQAGGQVWTPSLATKPIHTCFARLWLRVGSPPTASSTAQDAADGFAILVRLLFEVERRFPPPLSIEELS
jgi:hypothetical protein